MDDPREEQLIGKAKMGDAMAYEELLRPCLGAAARLAFALLGNVDEAEDVLQDAGLQAWRKIRNVDDHRPFRPWFLAVVANKARTHRKSPWWSVIRLPDIQRSGAADPDRWLAGEDLRRAIARLPHDQRVSVILHFHLDLSLKDVATATGISEAGVKSRINRALKRLRPMLNPREITP